MWRGISLLAASLTALAPPVAADSDTGCPTAPATLPEPGSDGSAPGNAGNTGWTGGTGGSHIGTSGQGAVAESRTWQPPTATGLDLGGTTTAPADC
ncbi:MAG: hypothetical protein QM699_15095 [Amaricoccus sp.]|uniref:hypothetical protein n=1 Tax=Amaricoccus sp. TaxID=1872485 RepID=UPI0039E33967